MQMREKVGKSRNTLFFQWFVAPEGRKVGSLKRRVRSQLARWEMKNCTPLWREAHVEVKMYKTPQLRSTLGSWDVEKVHAVVARSTCPSQNVESKSRSQHFWKSGCGKSERCGAKHISKSKCTKHIILRPLLEVEISKKCTPLWREAHLEVEMRKHTMLGPLLEVEMPKKCFAPHTHTNFQVKMLKAPDVRTTFGHSDVVSRGRRKGLCIVSRVSKTWRSCSISKNGGRRGAFEEDLERCISRGRRSTRDMFIRDVRRWGANFLRGVAFWSIRSSVLGRWFWVTGAALCMTWHHFFVAGQYFRQVEWKNRNTNWHEAVSSALNFPFEKAVSQNSFVFDVVNFENWGRLAELFRFWCCQVQKLRKSRRTASFSSLQVAARQIDR